MAVQMEEGLRWIGARVRELVDGVLPDAIQVRRRDGERSWPVHSFHRCENSEACEAAVRAELVSLVEEATETGRALHLRLVVVRGGIPHSSRAVVIPAPERASEEDAPIDGGGAAVGAVVATNRDLRSLLETFARQQGATTGAAMQGWASSMARTAELEREVAELRAALVLAEQAQQGDPVVQQALAQMVPQLPMLIASFAHKQVGGGS